MSIRFLAVYWFIKLDASRSSPNASASEISTMGCMIVESREGCILAAINKAHKNLILANPTVMAENILIRGIRPVIGPSDSRSFASVRVPKAEDQFCGLELGQGLILDWTETFATGAAHGGPGFSTQVCSINERTGQPSSPGSTI